MAGVEELGWLARTLTVLTKAMTEAFDADYPVVDFRDIHVSMDFPNKEIHYPGIWVDFEPTGELQTAGIGHEEFITGDDDLQHRVRRWTFQGYVTYTIVALSNVERARLVDEVVKIMAFGDMDSVRGRFRETIQSNDYIGLSFDFDQVGVAGKSEIQGTPWGSDDVIYEMTVRMEVVGEFVSDIQTEGLVLLSAINVYPYSTTEPDPGTVPPLSDDLAAWR